MTIARQTTRIQKRLAAKKALVVELSGGTDINLGSKSCLQDYSFFGDLLMKGNLNHGRRRIGFDAECEITRVTRTCSAGSQWLNKDLRRTSWRAELISRLFRDIDMVRRRSTPRARSRTVERYGF